MRAAGFLASRLLSPVHHAFFSAIVVIATFIMVLETFVYLPTCYGVFCRHIHSFLDVPSGNSLVKVQVMGAPGKGTGFLMRNADKAVSGRPFKGVPPPYVPGSS